MHRVIRVRCPLLTNPFHRLGVALLILSPPSKLTKGLLPSGRPALRADKDLLACIESWGCNHMALRLRDDVVVGQWRTSIGVDVGHQLGRLVLSRRGFRRGKDGNEFLLEVKQRGETLADLRELATVPADRAVRAGAQRRRGGLITVVLELAEGQGLENATDRADEIEVEYWAPGWRLEGECIWTIEHLELFE